MTLTSRLVPLLDDSEAVAFDGFLRASPFGAYQQSRAWAAACPPHPRRTWRFFTAHEGDAMVGACVIRGTRLAMGAWLATIQRGPVVHDPARLDAVLTALKKALHADGCCSVQLAPRVRGRSLPMMAEAMRAHGFAPLRQAEQALHHVTGVIWLDKPEAEVLAGFKQRGRRAIKAAEKAGIVIRSVLGADDLRTTQTLLDAFAAARPDYDRSGQPDAQGQAALVQALGGGLYLAERGGTAIGAHAWVRQGDEAIWLSLATVDRDGASPGYPLLWAAMRDARAQGCIAYDLAGLPDEAPADAGEAGRVQFKTAFAPHRRFMPAMQVAALDPLRHAVLLGARSAYRRMRHWRHARHG